MQTETTTRNVKDALFKVDTRANILKHFCHAITETATGRAEDAPEALNEIGFLLMALEEQIEALQKEVEAAEDAATGRATTE